jgi:hypothetical protein
VAKRKYFKEHIEYLREITPGRRSPEITDLFNKKFGMSASEAAVRTLRLKHGIKITLPRGVKQYTDEQIDYLKELSAQGLFNREITRRFNEKFGASRTEVAIQIQRCKYGFKTSARNYWKKGHEPWNKGVRGWSAPGTERTQFKPGHKPQKWVPVGSERITKDGYLQVKVKDIRGGMSRKGWKSKHTIVWEKHHGPAPKGHVVIFGDGNNRNFDISNLILVSRAQLAIMNRRGLIKKDVRLTRSGALIAKVISKAGKRRKEQKNEPET